MEKERNDLMLTEDSVMLNALTSQQRRNPISLAPSNLAQSWRMLFLTLKQGKQTTMTQL